MIVFIIVAGITLITGAFLVLPPLPPTPQVMIGIGDAFIEGSVTFFHLMQYIFGPVIFKSFLIVTFLIFFFEPIYHGVMWILRKIPMLGIN